MVAAVPDILARIVEHKRAELAAKRSQEAALTERAFVTMSSRRDFASALSSKSPAIIAEIKKASPSKGLLSDSFDPEAQAAAYETGGAAALSILTDEKHFQGTLAHLRAARRKVAIPVLRKDFTIDDLDVIEAAAHGADAILLIAAILTRDEMERFRRHASAYGMASLVEVHDERELDRALESGAEIIGVNNRNLHTFEVRLETCEQLAPRIPAGLIRVAESGIHSPCGRKPARRFGLPRVSRRRAPYEIRRSRGGLAGTRRMIVKICGVTSLDDALAAVDAGADALGFNFWPRSPRYIDPDAARAIAAGLPETALKVGVFVDTYSVEIADAVGIDILQIHGEMETEPQRPFWAAWPVTLPGLEQRIRASRAEAFLIDTPAGAQRGGTGRTFDWPLAAGLPGRIVLAGGLGADNVRPRRFERRSPGAWMPARGWRSAPGKKGSRER